MIAALAALPMAESVVGGVVGSVANIFAPAQPAAPAPVSAQPFASVLNQATQPAPAVPSTTGPGILRADQWNQMSAPQLQFWAQSLAGHHIDATDAAGHTVSGVVTSAVPAGGSMDLHVGGHVVSLSTLKQVNWSAAAA